LTADLLACAIRVLAFVSLFQASGAAFFAALFGPWIRCCETQLRRLAVLAAASGMLLSALQRGLEAARMGDTLGAFWDPALERLAWHGRAGNAALFELIGLATVALGCRRPGRAGITLASSGAVIACIAFTLTGHTSVHPQRALLAPLLAVHLLLVAFWFGALLPLLLTMRWAAAREALAILYGFSALAGALVPCIAVAGMAMALTLIPDAAGWRATYGLLLLSKLAVYCVLLLVAAWNRWRLLPAMAAGRAAAAPRLRNAIAVEYLLMVGVLAITAVLTSFYSP
jgi:putative copper resistance protein D